MLPENLDISFNKIEKWYEEKIETYNKDEIVHKVAEYIKTIVQLMSAFEQFYLDKKDSKGEPLTFDPIERDTENGFIDTIKKKWLDAIMRLIVVNTKVHGIINPDLTLPSYIEQLHDYLNEIDSRIKIFLTE
jgi:hypothetical protein